MISVYQLKSAFSDLLRPITRSLASAGITANQVTIAALLGSLLLPLCLWLTENPLWWLVMPIWMLIRMALNNIDGMLAREHDMATPLGAMLNEMADVISDSALFFAFALIAGVNQPLLFTVILLAVMSEMIGVVALQIGASRRYDGPSGKSDRALFFGFIALLYGIGVDLSGWINICLMIIVVLLVVTIFNRGHKALRETARLRE